MRLDTKFGPIDVTVQDATTVYVRVGETDATEAPEPLALPRNADACGRAHFHLRDEGRWTSGYGEWYLRRSDHRDLTPAMKEAAHEAIAAALATIDEEDLDAAQRAKNLSEATYRREMAKSLIAMADQLNRMATELELDPGARVVYLKQDMTSGFTQRATAVRTTQGDLLFVDEPRTSGIGRDAISGWRQYPDGGRGDWREVD